MPVRIRHNEVSLAIARRMVDEAYEKFPRSYLGDRNYIARCAWFREKHGLTIGYVQKAILTGVSAELSTNVVKRLGAEIWIRDPVTGLMARAELPTFAWEKFLEKETS